MNEWNGYQVQDAVDIKATDVPHFTGPNTQSNTHELIHSPTAPGPLATSVRALFGNTTFFNSIINANDTRGANLDVCRALRMPLTGLCTYRVRDSLMCNPYQDQSESTLRCIKPGLSSSLGATEDNYPADYRIFECHAFERDAGVLSVHVAAEVQQLEFYHGGSHAYELFYSAKKRFWNPSRATESSDWAFDTAFDTTETHTPLALPILFEPRSPNPKDSTYRSSLSSSSS